MMNLSSSIAFRTHISMSVGLGHYSRLENLEYNLNKKVIWFLTGDISIIKNLFKKKKFFFFKKNIYSEKKIIKFLIENNCRKVVMDLSYKKNLMLNKIEKIQKAYIDSGIKLISFDDARQNIVSNISIIPSINYRKQLKIKSHKSTVYTGKEYNFFPSYIKKYLSKTYFKNKIKKILISISGTDNQQIGSRILKLIINQDFKFTIIGAKKINLKLKKNLELKKNIKKINFLNLVAKKKCLAKLLSVI